MGFKDTQVLLNKDIKDSDKDRFKLLSILVDFGALSLNNENYKEQFLKLLDENIKVLNEDEIKIFYALRDSSLKGDAKEHSRLLLKTRHYLGRIKSNMYIKTKPLSIFTDEQIRIIYSWLSHGLHGNVFFVNVLFTSDNYSNQHKLRTYHLLLLSGLNVANHLEINFKDDNTRKEVDKFNETVKKYYLEIKDSWRKH